MLLSRQVHFRRHGNFKDYKKSGKPRILSDRENDKKQSYFLKGCIFFHSPVFLGVNWAFAGWWFLVVVRSGGILVSCGYAWSSSFSVIGLLIMAKFQNTINSFFDYYWRSNWNSCFIYLSVFKLNDLKHMWDRLGYLVRTYLQPLPPLWKSRERGPFPHFVTRREINMLLLIGGET